MNFEQYKQAADYIKEKTLGAKTAAVLGSGLGGFVKKLDGSVKIPYADIPHFPRSTAPSHEGALYCGSLGGKKLICMSGRFHYYEGYSADEIVFYIRALKLAGVKTLILTNAAGGITVREGQLMIIKDHINLTGISPLRGVNDDAFGVRFPDMTNAYTANIRKTALECAKRLDIPVTEGVYAYMTGPSYETPAEIRALKTLGADAVGMSTVPECICAAHCGMQVFAVSCITNMASGITGKRLSEQEVIDTAQAVHNKFSAFIESVIGEIGE